MFEQNSVTQQRVSISEGQFVQYVADNVNLNMRPLMDIAPS